MLLFRNNIVAKAVKYIFLGPPPQTQDVYIGTIAVGRGKPVFFVAEIGINHNGSIDIAKKLIDVALDAGAQAVKFQKRTVPIVYSTEELAKPRVASRAVLENAIKRGVLAKDAVERLIKSDFKDSTNGDLKWALEFTEPEYKELFNYAKSKGLLCFASPWDESSVDFLEKFDPPCYKIASASITDHKLLKKVRETEKPVIASTGMSTMIEINAAVNILRGVPLILLHTVSTYPAQNEELNLRSIAKLRQAFPAIPIGYSGHEKGIATSLAASVIGAHLIERHITLDRNMFGTDQSASLEPAEFAELIKSVREAQAAFGDGVKKILPSEVPIMKKLRKFTEIS